MSYFSAQVDLRFYNSADKNNTAFQSFNNLAPGQTMELIYDQDPTELHDQLAMQYGSGFQWEYLQKGPESWVVEITRT